MSELYIQGGTPLEGELTVQGAKNSVLPILAACLLAPGTVKLTNCPRLSDVSAALNILAGLGCRVEQAGHTVTVDAAGAAGCAIPEDRMRAMRSSIIFLGPLLARMGEAHVTYPGGCELGPRPIDLHLQAIRAMGCRVEENGGIHCYGRPAGGEVQLAIPSVGATENAMLCAAAGSGTTTITNAAREPEIVQLQDFLNAMGARVWGAGGSVIAVEGGQPLHGCEFAIMGDRIAAATLLSAAAAAGGEVRLLGVDWRHLSPVLSVFHQAGCRVDSDENGVALCRRREEPLQAVSAIRTAPYPGFPTDAQAPVMAALCAARGSTVFVENVFDSRYRHVTELRRMGADITTEGRVAVVRGVERLHGAHVEAADLRGGGALAVAALGAEGESTLTGVSHIDRGYEALEEAIRTLGGRAERRP
ncbi:MAG: UDP-N-acetylglucosamine 1-carboxyvinyltransferase [Candidatus Enterenecus sp.]